MNNKDILNSILAGLGTLMVYLFGGWDSTLTILAILMSIDYATGIAKGYKNRDLSSSTGFNGLIRKGAIFLVIVLAHQMDLIISIENPVFRTMAVLFYTANEGISVTENIALLGVPLPDVIIQALKKLKDTTI